MQHLCDKCGKPIQLVPSAQERVKKYGGTVDYYKRIFNMHNKCIMELRRTNVSKQVRHIA